MLNRLTCKRIYNILKLISERHWMILTFSFRAYASQAEQNQMHPCQFVLEFHTAPFELKSLLPPTVSDRVKFLKMIANSNTKLIINK